MPSIGTSRLTLRMFRPDDLDDLYSLFSDPDVVRYVGTGETASRAETETALQGIMNHWERHGFGRWAILDRHSQKFIGYGGLRMLIDTPEVVYHLAKAYWGMGLATEMATASLRFGFQEKNFERIVAIAKPENLASVRVMQKIGMSYERHTSYYNFPVIQYSILRENFRPADSLYILHRD
ncbi:MAG: GNAT family N-acetyltransferase [Pyrinomonadaceae bacterium]